LKREDSVSFETVLFGDVLNPEVGSMPSLTVASPAKINLALRVLGKRPDGYHDIFTLFQRISLADRIIFRKTRRSGVRLSCTLPQVPLGPGNLICKAYELLRKETGLRGGIEVELIKNIPLGGGLGGGSSNAASALKALNSMYSLGLKSDELIHLGKRLGADVPFFLMETSRAIGRGRGDELCALRGVSKRIPLLLVFFPEGLSTPAVYERYRKHCFKLKNPPFLTKVSADVTMLSAFLSAKNLTSAAVLLCNDLMLSACQIKPAIARVLSFLRTFTPACLMTGSGATVFALAESVEKAGQIGEKVSRKFGLITWTGSTD